MIIAHHLMWTAYGWWLPNDPRGSTSHTIRCDLIAELGELHQGRKRVQPASADIKRFYEIACGVLAHPLLEFSGKEAKVIGDALAQTVRRLRYTCYACAVLPDHVHVLIRKHRDRPEEMIRHFQESSMSLLREGGFRSANHPVWGGPGWKVFLDQPDEVRITIGYIRKNPLRIGLPEQHWSFVKEYDNWPLHRGHNPKSPYATHRHGEAFRWRKG